MKQEHQDTTQNHISLTTDPVTVATFSSTGVKLLVIPIESSPDPHSSDTIETNNKNIPVNSDKVPVSILKLQSSYKVGYASPPRNDQDKKLTFADDHGEVLSEDHFVDHLHYSPSSMSGAMDGPRGCCVMS